MAQSATVPRISSRTAHIALPINITANITKKGSRYANITAFHPIFCCTITSTSLPTAHCSSPKSTTVISFSALSALAHMALALHAAHALVCTMRTRAVPSSFNAIIMPSCLIIFLLLCKKTCKGTKKYAQIQTKRAKSLLLGEIWLYLGCVGWQ